MARKNSHDGQSQDERAVFVRMLATIIERPGAVVVALVVLTLALVVGGVASRPDKDASFDPGGEVFNTAENVERTFRSSTTDLQFIVEDDAADALDLATLREWKRNTDELRASKNLSPAFTTYFDNKLGRRVTGLYTIADAVDEQLRAAGVTGGLEAATEAQVKLALARVLTSGQPTALFRDELSVAATSTPQRLDGRSSTLWTSPAFLATVRVDNAAFPVDLENDSAPAARTDAQQDAIDAERDLEIERWARDALQVLRGDQQEFHAWGIAIDNGLTSDEAFTATIPYLIAAVALIVLLVGWVLRSYWAAALAGTGIALTLLWSRMIANLIGFDKSIVLNVLVPIATISFGVDFLIHAVGRVREELATGHRHRSAYIVGIASVAGALGLALATSALALASNATSRIQAVVEFGFGATIALAVAFLLLGIVAPAFLLRIEELRSSLPQTAPPQGLRRAIRGVGMFVAAVAPALIIVAIIAVPFVGLVGTFLYALLALALPARRMRRKIRTTGGVVSQAPAATAGASSALAGTAITGIVRRRNVVFVAVALVTVAAGIGAAQVGRQVEPRDFFPSDSDFIVGLDKLVEHTSTASPGDVYVYLAGDIADPGVLSAAVAARQEVSSSGEDAFARTPDGRLADRESAIDIARAGIEVEYARAAVSQQSGVALTDNDGNGLPDDPRQVDAVFAYAVQNGVASDPSTFVYTREQVARLLRPVEGGGYATVLRYPLQGFPDTEKIRSARSTVEENAQGIVAVAADRGLSVQALTSGDVVAEQVALDAVTDAMVISVPLAMLLCLTVAGFAMRSLRLAAVTIVPIALVVTWLLGFMAAAGYRINVITATIAAISVGVGIDFATHYTMRYREHLRTAASRIDAVRAAAEGTGTALILSGVTSIVGFGVLALAPMPVLAAYGLLTAVMIALSLAASLVVLPSLLYLLGPEPGLNSSTEETVLAEPAPSEYSA